MTTNDRELLLSNARQLLRTAEKRIGAGPGSSVGDVTEALNLAITAMHSVVSVLGKPEGSAMGLGRRATDIPRGEASRELYGWRVISCSDVRHSWVEVEAPAGPVELTPAMARSVADAIRSVAQYAGDSAVKHFVERGDA